MIGIINIIFLSNYGCEKLDRTSSQKEIQRCWQNYRNDYYRMCKKLHPDKNMDKEENIRMERQEKFKIEINKYQQICEKIHGCLCNEKQRYFYDRTGDEKIIFWRSNYTLVNNVDPLQIVFEMKQKKNKMN